MGGPDGRRRGRHGGGQGYPQEERPDGKKLWNGLPRKPAGGFWCSKKQPIDQIYAAIQEELRNQYSSDSRRISGYGGLSQTAAEDEAERHRGPNLDGFYLGPGAAD
jgi:hypothetical protein